MRANNPFTQMGWIFNAIHIAAIEKENARSLFPIGPSKHLCAPKTTAIKPAISARSVAIMIVTMSGTLIEAMNANGK